MHTLHTPSPTFSVNVLLVRISSDIFLLLHPHEKVHASFPMLKLPNGPVKNGWPVSETALTLGQSSQSWRVQFGLESLVLLQELVHPFF